MYVPTSLNYVKVLSPAKHGRIRGKPEREQTILSLEVWHGCQQTTTTTTAIKVHVEEEKQAKRNQMSLLLFFYNALLSTLGKHLGIIGVPW